MVHHCTRAPGTALRTRRRHAAHRLSTHQQVLGPRQNGPLLLRPECTFPFPPRPHSVQRRRSCLPLPTTRRPTRARFTIGWGRHSAAHEISAALVTHEDPNAACIGVAELMRAKEDTYGSQSENSIYKGYQAHEAAWRLWVLLSLRNHIRARTRLGCIRPPTPLVRGPSCPVSQLTHVT
jgi:hypothetical protein